MIFAALTSKLQEISTPRVSNLSCNFEATAQGDTGNFEAQPLASKLTNFDISCYRPKKIKKITTSTILRGVIFH